jgi:hypothetical protein
MMDLSTPLYLEYNAPAPEYADFVSARKDDMPNAGWEKWSLPLGNSRFGASIFGRTETDRIQITENSVANPLLRTDDWKDGNGGTRSFGDLIFEFGHTPVQNTSVCFRSTMPLPPFHTSTRAQNTSANIS